MAKSDNKIFQTVVIVGGVYFLVVLPILKKLGVIKSAAQSAPDTTAPANNVWSGLPYIQSFGTQLVRKLTASAKQKFAKTIYDALPTVGMDDSSAIIGVFRSINAKTQVADLADYFRKKYGYDLYDYLKHGRSKDWLWSSTTSGLASENIDTILDIVNAKPNK